MTSVLFKNARVLDSTGEEPYNADVLVEGDRITAVERDVGAIPSGGHSVVNAEGMTLMSGLCDAHTHFSWTNSPSIEELSSLPVEEHMLIAAHNAELYLDMGYTMCFSAGSAKSRLDIVVRNMIAAGKLPGPRFLACGQEIITIGAPGDHGDTLARVVTGTQEMRQCVRALLKDGADNIKLNMTGEWIAGMSAERTHMAEDEIAEAVRTTRNKPGAKVLAHARSNDSVEMCIKYGIDVIYHASFATDETIEKLAAAKEKHFVAPGIAWIYQLCYGASDWGITPDTAREMGYYRELEASIVAMKKMKAAGIRILPGGDYGFAWTPHGTYAKDLEYFVELYGFTPMEAIISATALGGEIMSREHELGKIQKGYLADIILVAGDPLADITILQDRNRIAAVMKGGKFHRGLDPARYQTNTISQ